MYTYAMMLTLIVSAQPKADDWATQESAHLKNIRQITTGFLRAGEGYFAPDGKKIIYQAEEKGTGNPFYQIFTQDLETGKFQRISPGAGRTTCAFFRPDGKRLIFASSHTDPEVKEHQKAEYVQREEDAKKGLRRRYSWDFDPHPEARRPPPALDSPLKSRGSGPAAFVILLTSRRVQLVLNGLGFHGNE